MEKVAPKRKETSMRNRVLFIIIAAAVAATLASSKAHAQDQPVHLITNSEPEVIITPIEPQRPREFAPFRFERDDDTSFVSAGTHRFAHRRDRDESPDGRRTRFERIYLSDNERSVVHWSIWRSGDRQDFHGGTKHKAGGIALSIVF